jgi:maleylpyruvate isomerase
VDSPPNAVLDPLRAASQRLVRTVDGLADHNWHAPSLLPGWTRAHVVAHLTLNAEGLAAGVRGVLSGDPVTMYASDQRRDSDILVLGAQAPARIRDRLGSAVEALDEALTALASAPGAADARIRRTPDGDRWFPAREVGFMRLREVEIHHADLGCDYGPRAWPAAFAAALLDDAVRRWPDAIDATLTATDLARSWQLGAGRPTVSGPVAGLAWWMTGRPPHPDIEVTSDDGALPRIEGM